MNDLRKIYEKSLEYAVEVFKNVTDDEGSFQMFLTQLRTSHLQVMALAIAAKSACVDSENWSFSKLYMDYRSRFPKLIDRTRFNPRRRQLQVRMELTMRVLMTLGVD